MSHPQTPKQQETAAGVSLLYLANCGLLVQGFGKKLLLDAIHTRTPATHPFSPVPEPLLDAVLAGEGQFAAPDYLLFTHLHRDHCDQAALSRLADQSVPIVLPLGAEDNALNPMKNPLFRLPPQGGKPYLIQDKGLTITALPTGHDYYGDRADTTPHYSFLLDWGNFRLLFLGDADKRDPLLAAYLPRFSIDLAVVNFVELNQAAGRLFLKEVVRPAAILLCHLPLAEDDIFHYQKLTRRNLESFGKELPPLYACWAAEDSFYFPADAGGGRSR